MRGFAAFIIANYERMQHALQPDVYRLLDWCRLLLQGLSENWGLNVHAGTQTLKWLQHFPFQGFAVLFSNPDKN